MEVIVEPGHTIPISGQGDHWHYHPAIELTLIQRGKGTRLVADNIELFEDGDLVLIGPSVPHYWHIRGESSGIAIQWNFPDEHGIWSFSEAAGLRPLIEAARRGLRLQHATATVIKPLMEEMTRVGGLHRLAAFLQIQAALCNGAAGDMRSLAAQPFSLTGTAANQESIRRAVSYILAHYRESIHLSDLLKLTGMSRPTFARQFLLHAGKSFSTFRNQIRLQAVCTALRETDEPISTIALNHGFNQLSFFNRLFLREFKMSPSSYRRRQRKRFRAES